MIRTTAFAVAVVMVLGFAAAPVHATPPDAAGAFIDDDGSVHEPNINAIEAAGITRGCNPPANTLFCPNRSLTRAELASLWQRLHDGIDDSGVDTPRRLAAFSNNADAATEAAEFAYRYGGGEALFDTSPLQRSLRDMRAASQHMLVSESNYEGFGKAIVHET